VTNNGVGILKLKAVFNSMLWQGSGFVTVSVFHSSLMFMDHTYVDGPHGVKPWNLPLEFNPVG